MNKKHFILNIVLLCSTLLFSCKKDDDDPSNPTPNPPPTPTAAKSFENITFNSTSKAYFSTDGSMANPVDSTQAKLIASKIDISFIYNWDYHRPGFMDPVTRSQTWSWNDYYCTGLSNAVETRYYTTNLVKAHFDSAKADQSKIAAYFSNSGFQLAPHAIFPTGTCIGGRVTSNPPSVSLSQGAVFGFKNLASGKMGLLYIRTGQNSGWPLPVSNDDTRVDLIREN